MFLPSLVKALHVSGLLNFVPQAPVFSPSLSLHEQPTIFKGAGHETETSCSLTFLKFLQAPIATPPAKLSVIGTIPGMTVSAAGSARARSLDLMSFLLADVEPDSTSSSKSSVVS
jgi:hypothetical protein